MLKKTLTITALALSLAIPGFCSAADVQAKVKAQPIAEVSISQLASLAQAVLDRVDEMQGRATDLYTENYNNGTWKAARLDGDERIKYDGVSHTSMQWYEIGSNTQDQAWTEYMNGNYKAALQSCRTANGIFKMLIDKAVKN